MKYFCVLVIIFGLCGSIQSAQAAEIFWRLPNPLINLRHTFVADVVLDGSGESVNAIEGTVHLKGSALKLEKIINANSIISLWVTTPTVPAIGQDIPFAGLITGGYSGRQGLLFSLVLTGQEGGSTVITVDALKAYLNDGLGSPVTVSVREVTVDVNPAIIESPTPILNFGDDVELPEDFTPLISRDKNLFNNKWFIAFSTQDKQSGVARYEIQELPGTITKPRPEVWVPVSSPYQLQDQRLTSTIFLRVFDNAGNTRVVMIPPKIGQTYSWTVIYSILIVIILLLIFVWWKRRKRQEM